MAMFGKKKETETPEAARDGNQRSPDLMLQRNRAQSIPPGPSRATQAGAASRPQRPSETAAGTAAQTEEADE